MLDRYIVDISRRFEEERPTGEGFEI